MRHILSALFVVIAASSLPSAAQQWEKGRTAPKSAIGGNNYKPTKGFISGTVVLSPEEKGRPETPGAGVTVTVTSSLKDRKYAVADSEGHFRIFGITPGKAIVSFSMIGYKKQEKVVDIAIGSNRIIANLEPDIAELQAAVKKETVSPVSVVKDTLIFHASAVKVNKGEMAIDILEQMPGVEVTDNGITVLQEQVENVYVDGALLFGNAPMTALNNLAAEDVVTIKSYQEYENKDPFHKISRNEEKKRVLDITTRSKPKFVKAIDAIAGAGFDTDSTYHKFRYTLGANANFFSEKFILRADFNVNNINNDSNRRRGNVFRTPQSGGSVDLRDIGASVNVRKKWMSPDVRNFVLGSIGGSYSYSDKYDVNESRTTKDYYPSDKYTSRVNETSSGTKSTDKVHTVEIEGMKALKDGKISADATYEYTESFTLKTSRNSNIQDGGQPAGTSSLKDSNSGNHDFSASVSFNKGFADKIRLRMNASGSSTRTTTGQMRTDTTLTTLTRKVLDIDGNGRSRQFKINPSVRWEINDNASLSAGYSYSDTYKRKYQLAMNVTDPLDEKIDTVNSRTFTTANKTHTASLRFEDNIAGSGAIMRLEGSYLSRKLGRNEFFPEDDSYGRPFDFFQGSASIGTETMINRWKVSYSTDCSTPTLEQVCSKLDNSNLYSVSVGNPDLVMSRIHNAALSYSTVLGATEEELASIDDGMSRRPGGRGGRPGGRNRAGGLENFTTFSVQGRFSATLNPIVGKQTYYSKDTYLPQYKYTMPAQSTLTSYENAEAAYSASFGAVFGTPLKRMRCLLNTSASFEWDSTPSFINGNAIRTSNLSPSVRANLRTNFSRDIRFRLNLNASYVNSSNDRGNSKDYFVERINFGWEFNNIFKHMYVGGNYLKCFTQRLENGKLNDNIFNVNIGAKFGPKNEYDISLSGNDLFDNTTGFSTTMAEDYVSSSWKHRFGRNVMLTFAYRFNKGGRRSR